MFQRASVVPQGQMFSLSQPVDILSSCRTSTTTEGYVAAKRLCFCGEADAEEVNVMVINRSLVSLHQGSLLVI